MSSAGLNSLQIEGLGLFPISVRGSWALVLFSMAILSDSWEENRRSSTCLLFVLAVVKFCADT